MTSAGTTHDRVRRLVAQDLRPVRPLLPPTRRVLIVSPIAAVLAFLAALNYGRRDDFEQLGGIITWGLSAIQWTIGLLILGIALRQAIPGYGVSRRTRWIGCGVAVFVILTVTVVTYVAHPTFVPPDRTWRLWYLCLIGPLKFGGPLLVVSSLLAARAFPTHPAGVGALCGLAAGVVADSGWRLTCWISVPTHVLGAHALAVALQVACGAALGTLIERLRPETSIVPAHDRNT